ncbi:arylesterase [Reyranella sp. CPCC 100927]|uniref:arylesterase n=1 Tax=Reyranella sp. CPCC 100927 TaxID=2599616 RepID=UPI00351A9B02
MSSRLADDSGVLAAMNQGYGDFADRVNGPARLTRSWGKELSLAFRHFWLIAALLCASVTAAHAQTVRIAMLGDSLTAGFGLPPEQALPTKLEQALKAAGRDVSVANHGVSGDTSAGGLARLDWTLGDKPKLVIVALGANDALRGLNPDDTEKNIDAIITRTKAAGAVVLLCGMKAPRNYGPEYVAKFDGLYERLAAKHGVALLPFLLDGVAMMPELNQADGIHPNAKGVDTVVAHLAPAVTKVLDDMKKPNG